jgi:hypothetical protein
LARIKEAVRKVSGAESPPKNLDDIRRLLPEFPKDVADDFRLVVQLLPTLHQQVRPVAVHAVRHLRRAWKLKDTDREMALFRAITGEEEAATALLTSLRRIDYRGARLLNPKRHAIKAGVWPMLIAANNFLAASSALTGQLSVEGTGLAARLRSAFKIPEAIAQALGLPDGRMHFMQPVFPLEFTIRRDNELAHFSSELVDSALHAGDDSPEAMIRRRADFRNRLLYADARGIPEVDGDIEPRLRGFAQSTRAILHGLFLVDPHPVQSLAQQIVDAYVRVIRPFMGAKTSTLAAALDVQPSSGAVEVLPLYERHCTRCNAGRLGLSVECDQCRTPLRGWKLVGVTFRGVDRVIEERRLPSGQKWYDPGIPPPIVP